MKVKDKVKVKENFENFEDDILEKKAEVQVQAKAKIKIARTKVPDFDAELGEMIKQ
jgi:nucleoid DNA-binding protein